jgi:REP element-mobilizing transposase RayT
MRIKKISRKPPRWDQDNSIYFLTFCTFDRIGYLYGKLIPEMIIENLYFYAKCLKELTAYTVMPDHIHLLVEIKKVSDLSDYLRDFKKRTAKEIKRIPGIDAPHIWQRGTMDHCIRLTPGNEDYVNHLSYIYYNCVKHLGIIPKEFPFHNFKEAVQKGWMEEDFGSMPPQFPRKFEIYE